MAELEAKLSDASISPILYENLNLRGVLGYLYIVGRGEPLIPERREIKGYFS
jgi:hypothetical protein